MCSCARSVILPANQFYVDRRLGHLHVEIFHRGAHDLRDRQVSEPFVIRRDDVPRRIFLAGLREHVLIGFHVVVPEFALFVVTIADLPVVRFIVQSRAESHELLFRADVQVELDHMRVVLSAQ